MNNKKELQRQQEDAAFAHGLAWIGGAIFVELLLVLINQFYFNFTTDPASLARAEVTYAIMRGCFFLAPLALIGVGVKGFLQFKKTGTISHIIEALIGLSAAISLVASMCHIYKAEGCAIMMLFVPVAGALAFGFFLYQRDFFYSAAMSTMTALVLWMLWHMNGNNKVIGFIGVAKVLVVAALLCWLATKLKQSDGTLTLMGHSVRFLPHDALYSVLYLSAGLSSAAVIIGLVLGASMAYYLIYAMGAWIFALLVYYTVRML